MHDKVEWQKSEEKEDAMSNSLIRLSLHNRTLHFYGSPVIIVLYNEAMCVLFIPL